MDIFEAVLLNYFWNVTEISCEIMMKQNIVKSFQEICCRLWNSTKSRYIFQKDVQFLKQM